MKYVKLNEKLNNIRENQEGYRDEIIHDEIDNIIDSYASKKAKYVDNLSVFRVNNHNIELTSSYFYNYTPLTLEIGKIIRYHGLETRNLCNVNLECDRYFINKLSTDINNRNNHINNMKVVCNEYIIENLNNASYNLETETSKIYCQDFIIRNNKFKHIDMEYRKYFYVENIIIENNNSLDFCELCSREDYKSFDSGFDVNKEHVGNNGITLTLKNNPKLEIIWLNDNNPFTDVYFGSKKDENEKVISSLVNQMKPNVVLHLSTGDITVEEYKNNYKNKQNK